MKPCRYSIGSIRPATVTGSSVALTTYFQPYPAFVRTIQDTHLYFPTTPSSVSAKKTRPRFSDASRSSRSSGSLPWNSGETLYLFWGRRDVIYVPGFEALATVHGVKFFGISIDNRRLEAME
ncbi:hypothetical protein MPH_07411 [Macrophomina phaseolina MS6]|uniref:Uncharacterized protein n=1 Tax=Macrophomina phaseolina (strain MS6) TaxID=1126212 RepID=K2SEU0_MACPH|nr:hypothetical protein MPH_07411 [Macrophomina phaseolina MS6]